MRRGRCLAGRLGERFTRRMQQTPFECVEQRRNMIQEFCAGQRIATGEIRITSDGALPGTEQRVAAVSHVAGQVGHFVNNIRHV
jgi:O-acetyl-ADP-ribose deacetylase (regulator of RNase III)